MKLRLMVLALFGSYLLAMENPNPSKREAEESAEQLQGESKVRRVEPIEEVEYPLASLAGLPVELKAEIFNFLMTAPGETKERQLLNAALNIRNFLMANKQFKESLDDIELAGKIIVQLASRYTDNDIVHAAITFNTNAASKWLADQIQHQLSLAPNGSIKSPLSESEKQFKDHLQNAIKFAFNNNRFDILRFLFAYKPLLANVDLNNMENKDISKKMPLLEVAVASNNFNMVNFLIKYGARITDDTIFRAAIKNSPEMLKLLAQPITRNGIVVSTGVDLNKRYEGTTLLFFAVNKDMVDYLVSQGLNVNERDNNNRTPLHKAIINGHYEVANALLDKEADPHIQDNYGNTPLHLLVSKKSLFLDANKDILPRTLAHMLEKTINLEIKNNLGNTPLAVAITAYNTKMVEQLLQKGAQLPESIYITGPNEVVMTTTPLQYLMNIPIRINAIDFNLLNILIVRGANVNETVPDPVSGEQITLLNYLSKQPWTPAIGLLIRLLKSHGAHE